jgi:hypothetical protein
MGTFNTRTNIPLSNNLDLSRWLNKDTVESSRSRSPLKRITEVPPESTPHKQKLMPPPPGRLPLLAHPPPSAAAAASSEDEPEASRPAAAAEKRKSRSKTRRVNKNAAASSIRQQGAAGNTTISIQVRQDARSFGIVRDTGSVNSGNCVSFLTLIGFFLYKSFWYGRPFFFSVDVQNEGQGSGSR